MSTQFTAMLTAGDADQAAARVTNTLARCQGDFKVVGSRVASQRHLMCEVLVEAPEGFDKDDAWVVLTSYGISPSEELGSVWQSVPGVGC